MNEQERQELVAHIMQESKTPLEPIDEFEMALFTERLRQYLSREAQQ